MPLQYQQLELRDFSGGITDKIVNAAPNQYSRADNLFISEYNTLESRPGYNVMYDQIVLSPILGLFDLNDETFAVRQQSLFLFNTGTDALDIVATPNANNFFIVGAAAFPNASEWRDQLHLLNTGATGPTEYNRPMRVWRDGANALQSVEMGIPYVDMSGVSIIPSMAGANSYQYSFHYSYTYIVKDTTFRNVGPITVATAVLSTDPGTNQIDVQLIPVISSALNNLDTATIKCEIYRTNGAAGTVFYKVGEVTNGTTVFVDNISDATAIQNATIYNTGGEVEHFQAPKSKYMTIVNDIAWYGNVFEDFLDGSSEARPYRIHQSIPGVPCSVDPSAFEDMDDEVIGVDSIGGVPIVFTRSYIYRLEGKINSIGQGSVRKRVISNTAGCASHNSIVKTNTGLYWAGKTGFYHTDGFNVQLLTPTLEESFRQIALNESRREKFVGTYEEVNKRIIWAAGESDTQNDLWFTLHLKAGGFTTASGTLFFSNSLLARDGKIMRGDNQGYIYEHAEDERSDYVRDSAVAASLWNRTNIPYDYESIALDFGRSGVRKWVSQTTIASKSDTNFGFKLTSNNDDKGIRADLKEVRVFGTMFWDDPDFVWGDADIIWQRKETHTNQRHFPRGSMRCRRKQIGFQSAEVVIYKSDTFNPADVAYDNPVTPTEFLVTIAGIKWPTKAVGYRIAFNGSSEKLNITARTDTTLTVTLGSQLPVLAADWEISGFPKEQTVEIKSIVVDFAYLDNVGDKFKSTEDGGNA